MGIFYSFKNLDLRGLLFGLYAGLAFGSVMSLLLVSLHHLLTAKYRKDTKLDTTSVVQKKFVEMNISFDQAYEKCLRSINEIKNCKIESEDRQNGLITAKISSSWRSFGEKVEIKLWNSSGGRTRIYIVSRPKMRTAILDYGKSIENVIKLSSALTKPT
jgi:hypothetical protein